MAAAKELAAPALVLVNGKPSTVLYYTRKFRCRQRGNHD